MEIPAKGHSYSTEWAIDNKPSCTENGYKSYHCEDCDGKKEVIEIPAIGHDYGEWICDKVATAWDTGREYRECSSCKEKEERIIEKVQGSGCNNSLGGSELSALLCVVLAIKKWIA